MLNHFLKNTILRWTFMSIMLIVTVIVKAQNSGDRLYSQGLELQKKLTVPSQRSAIAKFKSAKKLYDSTAKKRQCDDAIDVSNSIIKSLGTKNKIQEERKNVEEEKKVSVFEVNPDTLLMPYKENFITVNVTTTEEEWDATPKANFDGQSFVTVVRNTGNKSFNVTSSTNKSTRLRRMTIEVTSGKMTKTIVVEQKGRPVSLSVEKSVVEFSWKGGKKSVDINSDSEQVETDNNNRNWKVESKPDWITVIGEEKKKKNLIGKAWQLVASGSTAITETTSVMELVASSKSKNAPSRTGEVIISSGEQSAKIVVHQK